MLGKLLKAAAAFFILAFILGFFIPREPGSTNDEGATIEAKCIDIKSPEVIEVEGQGEIRLWGVEEKPEKREDAMAWLENNIKGKTVEVCFGDGAMYDEAKRPYGLVILKDDVAICANTELIKERLAEIDLAAPDKLDFIYHPAWLELGETLLNQLETGLARAG